MNWLKTRHSPRAGRIQAGDLDAAHGVANVEEAARLPALAVDRQRMADGGLRAEAVQHRAEDLVVVEAVDQASSRAVSSVMVPYTTPWLRSVARSPQTLQANMMLWLSCTLDR